MRLNKHSVVLAGAKSLAKQKKYTISSPVSVMHIIFVGRKQMNQQQHDQTAPLVHIQVSVIGDLLNLSLIHI